eukprot:CAMPEP_0172163902 /NCGR_PEP_ID=MMETSP1050-20130122/7535_1 /TAXON_ID=233186 /ORGANISM="Cryptomonas curvata, Strain CCAP979/52" /LENGTH=407 /DNA_ID=CAMNT_0012834155 /DNA_START=53 /DNA_END=1273 /DNA_ORIENTATION=+
MDSAGDMDQDMQESVGFVAHEIINCCEDGCDGEDSAEAQCGRCVLEEHPYPLKKNHKILTVQTTTIVRIPLDSQPSSRVPSISVTDSEEDFKMANSKDNCLCSPLPRGLLDSVGVTKEAEERGRESPSKQPPSRGQSPTPAGSYRTEPFPHQAGGARIFRRVNCSMLAKPYCWREAWFYRRGLETFKQVTPRFHGIRQCDKGSPSLLLEDLTNGYRCPCVLDIKMGLSTAAPDRRPEKLARCKSKDMTSTTGSLGARICGMRVYKVEQGEFEQMDKHWGKKLTPKEFCAGLERFFNNGRRVRRRLVPRFLDRLRQIQEVMEKQTAYHFFASSILFIYEGYEEAGDGAEDAGADDAVRMDVRMIDFAHVFEKKESSSDTDASYCSGLANLMQVLEDIAAGTHPHKIAV